MEIGDRIREIRAALGLSQRKFAAGISITGQAIAQFENGKLKPGERTIQDFCREYHVNESWLKTGKGEMFRSASKQEKLAQLINDALSDESDKFKIQLLSILSQLSPEQWAVLRDIARMLREEQDQEKSQS